MITLILLFDITLLLIPLFWGVGFFLAAAPTAFILMVFFTKGPIDDIHPALFYPVAAATAVSLILGAARIFG